jgi:hypothetical protein
MTARAVTWPDVLIDEAQIHEPLAGVVRAAVEAPRNALHDIEAERWQRQRGGWRG